MTSLPSNLDLTVVQSYLKQVCTERGFDTEDVQTKMMLLTEEVGELARAVRKHTGGKVSKETHHSELEEEVADVLIVLTDICNKLGVDLQQAFIEKEKNNAKRTWK